MLLEVDAIAYLPGWEKSRGATLEMSIAMALGLYVYDATRPEPPPGALLPPTPSRGGAHGL